MVTHFVSSPLSTACSFSFTSLPLHQNPNIDNKNRNNISPPPNNITTSAATVRCSSTRSHDRPTTGRFGIDPEDDYYYNYDNDEHVFDSAAKKKKQRNWWSDYDYDDYYELGIDEEDDFWVFKIFRAFGWMLPAIAISLLLGTGPNAFIMALAVPLGQSALSFAIDKVWGRTSSTPRSRPKTKTKKKPFARAASDTKTSKGQEDNNTGNGRESYRSWVSGVGGSYTKGDGRIPRYGGWDELDKREETQRASKRVTNQKANRLTKLQKNDRYSRIGRVRDTPLLLRLLVAVFPFLASWTKLFLGF